MAGRGIRQLDKYADDIEGFGLGDLHFVVGHIQLAQHEIVKIRMVDVDAAHLEKA